MQAAAVIYPVTEGPDVGISWIVVSWMELLSGAESGAVEKEPDRVGGLPAVVWERTAVAHSADRHNITTSRPGKAHTQLLRTTRST